MRAVLLALLVATVASAEEPPAVAAARRRQEALRSVEFNVRLKFEKESGTLRLVFDGSNARLEQRITGERARTWSAATDGSRMKHSLVWHDPALGGSGGSINPPGDGVCRDTRFLPLTLSARPFDPVQCPFLMDSLTPTGTEDIGEQVCDVFTGSLAGVPGTFWFDPTAGYSLRRVKRGGSVTEVESSNGNPAGVWLPTKYTVTKPNAVGRIEVQEYVVERVEVGKQYPASEFDPPWPAGLQVHDLIENRAFVTGADGVLQPIDERTVWQRVVEEWWVPVVGAAVVLVGGLFGWWVWRRRAAVE